MKRFAICALAVLLMAGVANAQHCKLWIQAPGGGIDGDKVCVGVTETAVIELWIEVYSLSYNGVLVAVDSILTAYDAAGTLGAQNFDVQGFTDYGPYGTFGRLDPRGLITVPGGDINNYQYLGVDENLPFTYTSGLSAGTYHLDDIIIHGLTPTQLPPCPPCDTATADWITFSKGAPPSGFWVWPDYFTTYGYMDLTVAFGTGAFATKVSAAAPLYVCVTPEPTALSLLLLGGLAVFRRR